jgi:putative transposase
MSRYRRSRIEGGTFFFTVTLANRESSILVERIGTLRSVYAHVQRTTQFETIAACILPDHLHVVWRLPKGDADYSSRWSRIKSGFSRTLPTVERNVSKAAKREKGIWQRRFWEHQIRDERDLAAHIDYIHFNPVKHGLVRHVGAWPHSSFHRYVKAGLLSPDWGGSDMAINVGEPD